MGGNVEMRQGGNFALRTSGNLHANTQRRHLISVRHKKGDRLGRLFHEIFGIGNSAIRPT